MPMSHAYISPKQPHTPLLVQPNLGIARGSPFYFPRSSEWSLLWLVSLRSLQPEPYVRQIWQKGIQAAALATQCTEASIPTDLLHSHSCGLTHWSFCPLGVLLSVDSRQETGLLPVISLSTYRGSFHCLPYYHLPTFPYFITFLVSLFYSGYFFS